MRAALLWGVALLAVLAAARDGADDWIARTDLPPLRVAVGTEVVARDGSLLRAFPVADGRWRLAPGPVDPAFVALLIAHEDRRFWWHGGVDLRAMARAAVQAARAGRIVSGGSTLTMQVARLLEEGPTGTLRGKLRQIRVALALERRLDKTAILDLYLRLAPYGGNLEGVRAASLAWFGKEPRRLTPAEAALLVALPQAPEARRPDRAPQAARAARNRVLARAGLPGAAETVPDRRRPFPALAPHLAQRLHRADPLAQRIVTTIDPALQRAAEALAARAVAGQPGQLSAALVVADHRSGEVLAHVGAAHWTDDSRAGFIDMAAAPRSPGSTLKPFVYALAFDDGLAHPETLIEDRPVAFGTWQPQNFDRRFRGTVSARAALQASLNIPVVRLTEAVGPARLMTTLARAGVQADLPGGAPGLAVSLGGVGISLEGLVQAYAGLARLGQPVRLSPLPGGAGPLPQRLFGAVAAWQVADVLAGLTPPAGAPAGRIAWKTGTSYGHRDALALGFDGAHVAGVWLGRPDGTPVPGAFGADLAAPILFELFGRLKATPAPLPPPPAATLLLPNARLPQPLQRFRPRDAVFADSAAGAPELAFPPDGAEIAASPGGLTVKLRGGTAPFTWLANGAPVAVALRGREAVLDLPGGFVALTVIDAQGRSTSAAVRMLP
ncbi:penicillin-binding protein 1C [Rhodobacter veldkampii DSM 11550]|uniref:peptidoglycan glycosyltransferase n=1 Tax=Phaeovulum veldkampii DSM 11550 TaxID=1185920 RepID=A0A2T4JJR2_9RHOB|nr:penicillin-binding protein 1C [Phaeovulum veldkampii]MBK5947236.1 penicillin-binding protein 1C [Phaeovulum veldkampii DSM 11550]PTE18017.1 penicillin-binding protein 1C [Phaeovulum veldkampii DSM 11550]TDQ60095.1 penicillin-binding protein 1C [Phaeovulum veldkampii DSM 11550]